MISRDQAIQIGSEYVLRRFKRPMKVCHCLFHDPRELFRQTGRHPPPEYTYIGARRRVWGVAFEELVEVDGKTRTTDAGLVVDVDAETGEPSIKEPILF